MYGTIFASTAAFVCGRYALASSASYCQISLPYDVWMLPSRAMQPLSEFDLLMLSPSHPLLIPGPLPAVTGMNPVFHAVIRVFCVDRFWLDQQHPASSQVLHGNCGIPPCKTLDHVRRLQDALVEERAFLIPGSRSSDQLPGICDAFQFAVPV
jgi:hypothetical protein